MPNTSLLVLMASQASQSAWTTSTKAKQLDIEELLLELLSEQAERAGGASPA